MNNRKLFWVILTLASGYWLLDSAIDAFVFQKEPFLTQIFNASPHDILMRALVALLLGAVVYSFVVVKMQKKAEEALYDSEKQYRILFESNPNPMWVYDMNTLSFLEVNEAAIKHYGYSRDEFLKMTIKDIRPEEDIPPLIERISGIGVEISRSGDWRHTKKNGSIIQVEITSHGITFNRHNARLVLVQDITERKKAEGNLNKTIIQQKAILDNIPDIAWLKDKESRFIAVNESFEKICGVKSEDLAGKTDFDIWSKELAERYRTDDIEVMKSGKRKIVEEPLAVKEGKIAWIETIKTPIYNEKGEIIGTTGIARDITERKQVENALQEKEHLLSESQRIAHIGSWAMEIETDTMSWADETYRIFGRSPDTFALTPKSFISLIHPDDRSAMQEWIRACLAGENPGNLIFRIVMPDNTIRFIDGRGDLLCDDENKPVRMVGTAQDITERKQAEEALLNEQIFSQSIINSLPGVFCLFNKSAELIRWNRNVEIVSEHTASELKHMSALRFVLREEHQLIAKRIQEVWSTGHTQTEATIISKSGKHHSYYFTGSLIQYNNEFYLTVLGIDITERKQAEEALIEAELRFSSLMQAAGDAIIMSGASGNVLSWNAGAQKIFGYTAEEITGKSLTTLMPERYIKDHLNGMQRVIKTGQSQYLGNILEFHGIRKDGSEFPLELSVNTWQTQQGYYFLGIIRDISERRKTEESLEEQKKFAESLIENSAVATFVITPDHKIALWNKACEELTGIQAAEMIGTDNHWKPFYSVKRQTIADIIIEGNFADLPVLYSKYSKSSLISNGLQSEGWYPDLNGKDRYIIFDAAPLFDSKGALAFVIETLHDITERKVLEKALMESEERLKTIINTEPHCVKLLNADGTLIEMNPAGLAMIEADSFEQVKGASLFSLLAPEHRNAFKSHVEEVFAGGSGTLEFEIIGLKKTHRWLSTHSVPFRNSNGEIIALLGITRDITEQKKLEDQLRQAQKMEAIGQLAGGIAHDFNNLLSAIMGYTHLTLMRMNESDPLRTNLDQVLEATDRAAVLTQSLLAFSRKQTVHLSMIDLNALIRKFEKFLLRLLREDIELKTIFPDPSQGGLMIMADSGQIEQVLMNLVTNARDAMPEGGRLTIKTELVELDENFIEMHGFGKPGKYAMISVSDTGSGIDEETKIKIFEPFFTTKEVGKGTGLGLAMVYGTIKKHDGYINVYSEKDKGTTFRIYLPIASEEAEKEKTEKLETLPVQSGTETILVAEDDATLRKLSTTVLRHYGYNIIEAEDGEEAVRKYFENKDKISLVILDGIMPKKNGKEAYEEIKILWPDIKAIFVSGYTSDIFGANRALDKEINFITKPVSPIELAKKVREILDK